MYRIAPRNQRRAEYEIARTYKRATIQPPNSIANANLSTTRQLPQERRDGAVSPRRTSFRSASPRRTSYRSASPRRDSFRSASPHRDSFRSASPHRDSPRSASPRSASPRSASPRSASPRSALSEPPGEQLEQQPCATVSLHVNHRPYVDPTLHLTRPTPQPLTTCNTPSQPLDDNLSLLFNETTAILFSGQTVQDGPLSSPHSTTLELGAGHKTPDTSPDETTAVSSQSQRILPNFLSSPHLFSPLLEQETASPNL